MLRIEVLKYVYYRKTLQSTEVTPKNTEPTDLCAAQPSACPGEIAASRAAELLRRLLQMAGAKFTFTLRCF